MRRVIGSLLILFLLIGAAYADIPSMRRTTLHGGYDSEKLVSEDEIKSILEAAFSMPTGGDQRALEFFVVTDRETMQRMKGGNPWSQAMDTAPCVIVVAGDTETAFYDELLEMDAGIAAGAMLIQAADMGLATCVLSIAPQETRIKSVKDALATESIPILMIAFGYPNEDAISSASVDGWDNSQVFWK